MKRIDSHQHFWQVDRGDYSWLTPDLTVLYKDHLPADIQSHLSQANISQTILVQAADTLAETEFLLQLAEQHEFIAGVVGWVDMESDDCIEVLKQLKQNPYFKGIRPMIQDIADDAWMLNPELTPVFEALVELDLTFDALVLPKQLANLKVLLNRHPNLSVVIDHGAKPKIVEAIGKPIESSINKQWAIDMKELSGFANVYCKLSGLLTEAGEQPTYDSIKPYMSHLLHCFGAHRLMWGSDWPVVNLAGDYQAWTDHVTTFVEQLSEQEQALIFSGVAEQFYRI
ncbi:amidohydrolase [Thalassotalea sp. HSM 43]|uniref:amidohydrolase family protein n=1 Tax=Thalassotalea sp. HSM 43 TaxID=2552945 RepID=UPI0010802E74|nr:amidohydrolase family protein [Thalassotalea sp. HSM 43]QBY03565.1 amidohydrolase [Thalassotalea sp. HSM 43]